MSSVESYPNATIEQVRAFNQELVSIVAAGIPIETGFSEPQQTLEQALDKAVARICLEVSRGSSVESAVANIKDLPKSYRSALETYLHCDDSSVAFERLAVSNTAMTKMGESLNYAIIKPLILLSLLYFGYLFLCFSVAPRLERVYQDMWKEPDLWLQMLLTGREYAIFWGPITPAAIIIACVAWSRSSIQGRVGWLPQSRQHINTVKKSEYATQLATLMESGQRLSQALVSAGSPPTPNSAQAADLELATTYIIAADENNMALSPDTPEISSIPPMLRWALTNHFAGQPRSTVLRCVASIYQQTAKQQLHKYRLWVPVVLGAGLGGLIVLFYALSLFLPVTSLLLEITNPEGVE